MTPAVEHVDDLVSRPDTERVHFGSWVVAVRRSVLRFRFDCDNPGAFTGAIRARSLGDVNFVDMVCGRHAAYREHDTITDEDSGFYVMTLQLAGRLRMEQDGRAASLGPGGFAVYDSALPATITTSDDHRSTCLRFPKERLGSPSAEPLAGLTATAFEYAPGLSALAWDSVLALHRNLDVLGTHGPLAVRSTLDLVRTMLCAELGDPARLGPDRRGQALLRDVREYIDLHLGEPDLSPARIAAAHHVSVRTLHALFAPTDHSVARWIRDRRIQMCRRDLSDPRTTHLPVAAIAARWGFAGPSHFGQVFKHETGHTPNGYRALVTTRVQG